jgi:tripartite-type tricarboxylate transporter receptor subunit TctC
MSWHAKLFFAASAWLLAAAMPAAAYPDRPVTIVVPFAAGGPSDIIARIIAEHWSPKFQATGWNVLLAPKGTPNAILDQLNAAGMSSLKDEGVRKRLLELGAELPEAAERTRSSAAELVSTEIEKWVPVIKAAGVVVN